MNCQIENWNMIENSSESSRTKKNTNEMMEKAEERMCKWKCTMSLTDSESEAIQKA
ncbi:MAG: hypothetical protein IKP58_07660 [Victivallales bacterium]|nr:hypothetical protein [Victivallales bacterium]